MGDEHSQSQSSIFQYYAKEKKCGKLSLFIIPPVLNNFFKTHLNHGIANSLYITAEKQKRLKETGTLRHFFYK